MATVTVELRELLRNNFKLFDFEYEFDDKEFKQEIEQAVIDYYYFHEIGQETPARFKHRFKSRWLSMISYYNKLHNTTLLKYNPLINYKMDEALEQLSKSNSVQDTTSNTTTDYTENVGSDTHTQQSNTTMSSEDIYQSTTLDNTRTDNLETSTDITRTDNLTSTTVSTRTDNLTTEENTNEKSSDYPQQPIAGGDFLQGERDSTRTQNNTGTVTNDNTTTDTGTVNTETTTTNTGTVQDSGTTTLDGTTTTNSESNVIDNTTVEGTTTGDKTDNTTSNTTKEDSTNTNYKKTIEGLTGKTYQELIQLERDNLIRIKSMIINELKPCFLLVYS